MKSAPPSSPVHHHLQRRDGVKDQKKTQENDLLVLRFVAKFSVGRPPIDDNGPLSGSTANPGEEFSEFPMSFTFCAGGMPGKDSIIGVRSILFDSTLAWHAWLAPGGGAPA